MAKISLRLLLFTILFALTEQPLLGMKKETTNPVKKYIYSWLPWLTRADQPTTNVVVQPEGDNPDKKSTSFTQAEVDNIGHLKNLQDITKKQQQQQFLFPQQEFAALEIIKSLDITTPHPLNTFQKRFSTFSFTDLYNFIADSDGLQVTCLVKIDQGPKINPVKATLYSLMGKSLPTQAVPEQPKVTSTFESESELEPTSKPEKWNLSDILTDMLIERLNSLETIKQTMNEGLSSDIIEFINSAAKEQFWEAIRKFTSAKRSEHPPQLTFGEIKKLQQGKDFLLRQSESYFLAYDQDNFQASLYNKLTKDKQKEFTIPKLPKDDDLWPGLAISPDATYIAYYQHTMRIEEAIKGQIIYILNTQDGSIKEIKSEISYGDVHFDAKNNLIVDDVAIIAIYSISSPKPLIQIGLPHLHEKDDSHEYLMFKTINNKTICYFYSNVHKAETTFAEFEKVMRPLTETPYNYEILKKKAGEGAYYTLKNWEPVSPLKYWIREKLPNATSSASPLELFTRRPSPTTDTETAYTFDVDEIIADRDLFQLAACVNKKYAFKSPPTNYIDSTVYTVDLLPDLIHIKPNHVGFYLFALDAIGWDKNRIKEVNNIFPELSSKPDVGARLSLNTKIEPKINPLKAKLYSWFGKTPPTPKPQTKPNELRERLINWWYGSSQKEVTESR